MVVVWKCIFIPNVLIIIIIIDDEMSKDYKVYEKVITIFVMVMVYGL